MTATDVLTWLSVACLSVHKWQLYTSEKQRHTQGLIMWTCRDGSSIPSPTSWLSALRVALSDSHKGVSSKKI
ncbi:hypothetical protein HRbin36_02527 [bacterium HR36]|nr:hypothetical protein HRbin36_02527 [bacterium HR36]